MPTLNKRQSEPEEDQSKWFIVTSGPDHPYTFQVEPDGYRWLLAAGLGHKSTIDWDVFETLRALDLLYTRNSPYTPADAPVPDDLSFEEIPIKERIRLGEELLKKYSVTELSAQEGTLQFLLSIGDLDWKFQKPILETLLSQTPFDAIYISDYQVAFNEHSEYAYDSPSEYNPVLLALIFSVAYDAIEPKNDIETINEGNPVWTYDDWIVCAGTELIFYEVNDVITDALPDRLRTEIVETADSIANEGHFYAFFEQEFSALAEFQFIMRAQDTNPWLGSIIADGLRTGYRNSVLILPGSDTEENNAFNASDEPGL